MSTRSACPLVGARLQASCLCCAPVYIVVGLGFIQFLHPSLPCKVFSLPPSVLRYLAQEPSGTKGAYKAAVDSFLQQQHAPAQGEEQLSQPGSQDPQSPAGLPTAAQTEAQPPTAAQTEALCRLFDSVKTLTAKEELLQTLR